MAFDRASLKKSITSRLAGTSVAIELGDADFTEAANAACLILARYRPQKSWNALPITVGTQKYELPAANFPSIIGVVDVEFFSTGLRLDRFPYPDSMADQALILADIKDMQRIYADLPQWEWQMETDASDQDKEKCYLYVYMTQDSYVDRYGRLPNFVSIRYNWAIQPTDDKKVGLVRVPYDLREWFVKYATEVARGIMGQARDKFGGIPGPNDGEIIQVDGGKQVDRSDSKLEKLEEDLRTRMGQSSILID